MPSACIDARPLDGLKDCCDLFLRASGSTFDVLDLACPGNEGRPDRPFSLSQCVIFAPALRISSNSDGRHIFDRPLIRYRKRFPGATLDYLPTVDVSRPTITSTASVSSYIRYTYHERHIDEFELLSGGALLLSLNGI
jgi:hypothetical protein